MSIGNLSSASELVALREENLRLEGKVSELWRELLAKNAASDPDAVLKLSRERAALRDQITPLKDNLKATEVRVKRLEWSRNDLSFQLNEIYRCRHCLKCYEHWRWVDPPDD